MNREGQGYINLEKIKNIQKNVVLFDKFNTLVLVKYKETTPISTWLTNKQLKKIHEEDIQGILKEKNNVKNKDAFDFLVQSNDFISEYQKNYGVQNSINLPINQGNINDID